jgi:hypothetical protein
MKMIEAPNEVSLSCTDCACPEAVQTSGGQVAQKQHCLTPIIFRAIAADK